MRAPVLLPGMATGSADFMAANAARAAATTAGEGSVGSAAGPAALTTTRRPTIRISTEGMLCEASHPCPWIQSVLTKRQRRHAMFQAHAGHHRHRACRASANSVTNHDVKPPAP